MGVAITLLINLIEHMDPKVRSVATSALNKLANYGDIPSSMVIS